MKYGKYTILMYFALFYILNYVISYFITTHPWYSSSILNLADRDQSTNALFMIAQFIIFLIVTYVIGVNIKTSSKLKKEVKMEYGLKKTIYCFLVFSAVAILAKIYLLILSDFAVFTVGIDARASSERGHGFLSIIAHSGVWLIFISYFAIIKKSRSIQTKLLVLIIAVLLLFILVLRGSRGLLLEALLPFVFVKIYGADAKKVASVLALTIVFFTGLIVLILRSGIEMDTFGIALVYAVGASFSNYEVLLSVISNLQPMQFGMFGTIAESVIYQFIPRFIWDSKPQLYGNVKITESYSDWWGSGTSVPADMLSEAYINLGMAGLAVYGIVFGILLVVINKHISRKFINNDPLAYFWLGVGVVFCLMLQRLGVGAVIDIIVRFSPLILFIFIVKKRAKLLKPEVGVKP